MSDTKNNGGPAFPTNGEQFIEGVHGIQPQSAYGMHGHSGMTLRSYACIHLRTPDSEHEWLNDIIRRAQRDELAAKAMQALIQARGGVGSVCSDACEYADLMLKAHDQ